MVAIIPQTNIHQSRIVDQIVTNLVGLQRDMHNNAAAWLAMANALNPAPSVISGFISSACQSYLSRLQWVNQLMNDGTRWPAVSAQLAKRGWSDSDVSAVLVPLHDATVALNLAPNLTHLDIAAACNAMTAAVQSPDSLWPEA